MRTNSRSSRSTRTKQQAETAMRTLSSQPWQIIEYFNQRREQSLKKRKAPDLNPQLVNLLDSFKEQVLHIN
jgi:hypothetical protein